MTPIPLGDWAPDAPATAGGDLITAKNVIPYRRHYAPLKKLAAVSEAIDSRPLGACSARDEAAGVHIYAADAGKIYEQNSDGSWTDRSRAAGYTATEATRVRFWTYGDRILATNGQDEVQSATMSTSGDFDDLAGGPPIAQFGCAWKQFNILANTENSAFEVVASSIGDCEAYVEGVNQSWRETFTDGGHITGLVALDALYIFQETCIRRVVYVGPPEIVDIDVIEKERGCIAPGSLAQLGALTFFRAEDGFYVFNGESSMPIGVDDEDGASKFDEWFAATAQRDFFYRMSSAIDPATKTYRTSFPSTNSATGRPDKLLIYNWAARRAAYADFEIECLAPFLTPSLTLEDLDALYGELESVPVSLDDPSLAGGVVLLGAMTPDMCFSRFAGDNAEAVFITDDFVAGDLGVQELQAIAPLVDGDCKVKIGYRFTHNSDITWTGESSVNREGVAPVRAQGRFLRVELRIPEAEDWTKAEGFAPTSVKRGQ